jgi:predicted nucleic acid-binding protein
MPASELFVLDTSALICLKEDETGAADVERILRQAGPKDRVYISFISLMEFFYILQQEQGERAAQKGYLEIKQLPINVIESDEQLGLSAAAIKATHKLSVADAWVAATAQRLAATLVHKDPEFEPLMHILALHPLPYNQRRA